MKTFLVLNLTHIFAVFLSVPLRAQTVHDVDGNVYSTISIGSQTWMAENLKTTKYSDGTLIPNISSDNAWYYLGDTGKAYCWNVNHMGYKEKYGALYTWAAVMNTSSDDITFTTNRQGVCPLGWHVPSSQEWAVLVQFLGGEETAGGMLKEKWDADKGEGWVGDFMAVETTNSSGFTARQGGFRGYDTKFAFIGSMSGMGYWWTATQDTGDTHKAVTYRMMGGRNTAGAFSMIKRTGCSVRCIKD